MTTDPDLASLRRAVARITEREKANHVDILIRDRAIARLRLKGWSLRRVAHEAGMSHQRVAQMTTDA